MEVRAAWAQHRAMRNTFYWLFSLALAPLPIEAQVTVTLFDLAGLRAETVETMKSETSRIFLAAGITVNWVDCERAGMPLNLAECARPLGATRLMLQLAPGANKAKPRSSGFATLQNGAGSFACLYPVRVQDLAIDTNWEFGDLLGHVAAHEIGHLLLRTDAHSPAGIMRARWETDDLRRLSHRGLVFLAGQLATVDGRLTAELK